MTAMQEMMAYLRKSPSLVYPADVLEYAVKAEAEDERLRSLVMKMYGYYVSGTLTPCDFCDRYSCEGDAPTTCKLDEYDQDGIVTEEIDRRMRELGIEVNGLNITNEPLTDMAQAATRVLTDAAALYNDAEILRDAIEGDERDQIGAEMTAAERGTVRDTAERLRASIDALLAASGVETSE